jgi:hypothetical protein
VVREGATSRNRGRRGGLPLPAAKVLAGEHGNSPRGYSLSHYRHGKKEREAENSTRGLEALWKARRQRNTHGGGSDVAANQRRCREVVTDRERGRTQYHPLTYQLAKLVEMFSRAEE